jgi:hypothetical protein
MPPPGQLRYDSRTPRPADRSRELYWRFLFSMRPGGAGPSIDSMADELDDIARGLDIERSNRFSEEQRPPHWRHRVCARLDRLVLADVWPRCRRRDHGRGRVSGAPPPAMDGHLGGAEWERAWADMTETVCTRPSTHGSTRSGTRRLTTRRKCPAACTPEHS